MNYRCTLLGSGRNFIQRKCPKMIRQNVKMSVQASPETHLHERSELLYKDINYLKSSSGRNLYIQMWPYSWSSFANSADSISWCSDGKYLKAFAKACCIQKRLLKKRMVSFFRNKHLCSPFFLPKKVECFFSEHELWYHLGFSREAKDSVATRTAKF